MHILSSHRCEWELIIIILLAASNSTLADNVALKGNCNLQQEQESNDGNTEEAEAEVDEQVEPHEGAALQLPLRKQEGRRSLSIS